jgi:hypothetical protein
MALQRHSDDFGDVETCRSRCQIDQFLLERYRSEIEAYIQQVYQLPRNNSTRGFIKAINTLKEVLEQGATACSCKRCEKIGDAVIALDTPRRMRLEHTDNSFDYLFYVHQLDNLITNILQKTRYFLIVRVETVRTLDSVALVQLQTDQYDRLGDSNFLISTTVKLHCYIFANSNFHIFVNRQR